MIFGDPNSFAIEALTEPSPDYPAIVGKSLAGRIRCFVGGEELGDFNEPCCVFGGVSDHLAYLCSAQARIWHHSLVALAAPDQFQLLDNLIYGESSPSLQLSSAVGDTIFLTNLSEAFDGLKAFIIRPPGWQLVVLVERDELIRSFQIPIADFQLASRSFANWLELQDRQLFRDDA